MAKSSDERLIAARDLYVELGTLEAVGAKLGITRERVRQLIVKGSKRGLYDKPQPRVLEAEVNELIRALESGSSIRELAQKLGFSEASIRAHISGNAPPGFSWRQVAEKARRYEMIAQYLELSESLGHYPTTTEMQKTSTGHALHSRILRTWGSIEVFRLENGFPKVAQGNPRMTADVQKGLIQHRARLAQRRKLLRALILETLELEPMRISQLHAALKQSIHCSENLTRRLVDQLQAEGKITQSTIAGWPYYGRV